MATNPNSPDNQDREELLGEVVLHRTVMVSRLSHIAPRVFSVQCSVFSVQCLVFRTAIHHREQIGQFHTEVRYDRVAVEFVSAREDSDGGWRIVDPDLFHMGIDLPDLSHAASEIFVDLLDNVESFVVWKNRPLPRSGPERQARHSREATVDEPARFGTR